jgi:hypothetical protein
LRPAESAKSTVSAPGLPAFAAADTADIDPSPINTRHAPIRSSRLNIAVCIGIDKSIFLNNGNRTTATDLAYLTFLLITPATVIFRPISNRGRRCRHIGDS